MKNSQGPPEDNSNSNFKTTQNDYFLPQEGSISDNLQSFNSTFAGKSEDDILEIQNLASDLGIDFETEKTKYYVFLTNVQFLFLFFAQLVPSYIQLLSHETPPGWKKERDYNGKLIYYNESTRIISNHHPNLSTFQKLFYNFLKEEEIKQEEKKNMMGQIQTVLSVNEAYTKRISNKRQKLVVGSSLSKNILMGDANDKFVKNRDKVGILFDGNNSITKEYLSVLAQQKKKVIQETNSLYDYETYLNLAMQYYCNQYGFPIDEYPQALEKTDRINEGSPFLLIEYFKYLDIKLRETGLYWVGDLLMSLPLPPLWTKVEDQKTHELGFIHMNAPKMFYPFHPAYPYCKKIVDHMRLKYGEELSKFRDAEIMTFCDNFGRIYQINMKKMFELSIKNKINNVDLQRECNFVSLEHKENELAQPVTNIARRWAIKEDEKNNPNIKDFHFLELAKQLNLQLSTQIHLLQVIEEFVREKDKNEKWFFRQTNMGDNYWVNHKIKKASKVYPFMNELKNEIIDHVKKFPQFDQSDFKSFQLLNCLCKNEKDMNDLNSIRLEATDILESSFSAYYNSKTIVRQSEIMYDMKEKLVNALDRINKLTHQKIQMSDLFYLIFYCPFNLQQKVKEGVESLKIYQLNPDGEFIKKYNLIQSKTRRINFSQNKITAHMIRKQILNAAKKDSSLSIDDSSNDSIDLNKIDLTKMMLLEDDPMFQQFFSNPLELIKQLSQNNAINEYNKEDIMKQRSFLKFAERIQVALGLPKNEELQLEIAEYDEKLENIEADEAAKKEKNEKESPVTDVKKEINIKKEEIGDNLDLDKEWNPTFIMSDQNDEISDKKNIDSSPVSSLRFKSKPTFDRKKTENFKIKPVDSQQPETKKLDPTSSLFYQEIFKSVKEKFEKEKLEKEQKLKLEMEANEAEKKNAAKKTDATGVKIFKNILEKKVFEQNGKEAKISLLQSKQFPKKNEKLKTLHNNHATSSKNLILKKEESSKKNALPVVTQSTHANSSIFSKNQTSKTEATESFDLISSSLKNMQASFENDQSKVQKLLENIKNSKNNDVTSKTQIDSNNQNQIKSFSNINITNSNSSNLIHSQSNNILMTTQTIDSIMATKKTAEEEALYQSFLLKTQQNEINQNDLNQNNGANNVDKNIEMEQILKEVGNELKNDSNFIEPSLLLKQSKKFVLNASQEGVNSSPKNKNKFILISKDDVIRASMKVSSSTKRFLKYQDISKFSPIRMTTMECSVKEQPEENKIQLSNKMELVQASGNKNVKLAALLNNQIAYMVKELKQKYKLAKKHTVDLAIHYLLDRTHAPLSLCFRVFNEKKFKVLFIKQNEFFINSLIKTWADNPYLFSIIQKKYYNQKYGKHIELNKNMHYLPISVNSNTNFEPNFVHIAHGLKSNQNYSPLNNSKKNNENSALPELIGKGLFKTQNKIVDIASPQKMLKKVKNYSKILSIEEFSDKKFLSYSKDQQESEKNQEESIFLAPIANEYSRMYGSSKYVERYHFPQLKLPIVFPLDRVKVIANDLQICLIKEPDLMWIAVLLLHFVTEERSSRELFGSFTSEKEYLKIFFTNHQALDYVQDILYYQRRKREKVRENYLPHIFLDLIKQKSWYCFTINKEIWYYNAYSNVKTTSIASLDHFQQLKSFSIIFQLQINFFKLFLYFFLLYLKFSSIFLSFFIFCLLSLFPSFFVFCTTATIKIIKAAFNQPLLIYMSKSNSCGNHPYLYIERQEQNKPER